MPEQVEVDPRVAAPPFGTAERVAVEATGSGEIVDGESEVERTKGHASGIRRHPCAVTPDLFRLPKCLKRYRSLSWMPEKSGTTHWMWPTP